ncbi:MAG: hypothetical protein ACOYNL_06975 [Rickettsiales bacterium]
MDPASHIATIEQRVAKKFLGKLLAYTHKLVDEYQGSWSTSTILSPEEGKAEPGLYSGYIVERYAIPEEYALRSAGVESSTFLAIVKLLETHYGMTATMQAVDERDKPVDMNNPDALKNISQCFVKFPNGVTLRSVADLGNRFAINLPGRDAFDHLAAAFASKQHGQGI